MNKAQLIRYCEEKGIFVPRGATLEYLNAAIVRAFYHLGDFKTDQCFGFWQNEDAACVTCDFENKCFKASVGMEKEEYFKKIEAAENPKFRFVEARRK
jgi:hypothetical protein